MQPEAIKTSTRRRPERLFISLNAREKAAIETAANEAQLNMTEWARSVLLTSAKKEVRRSKRVNGAIEQSDDLTMGGACPPMMP